MTTEINHDDVATQLVYLVAGIETQETKYRVTQRLLGNDDTHPLMASSGHIGMVCDLLPYAKAVSARLATQAAQEFPGVYEYEVTECMGIWLARAAEDTNEGLFPYPNILIQFNEQLEKLTTEFFNQ